MRKSFILSLVMVVVLIASLATATFAWYTAQLQVTASSVTLGTATVDMSLAISNTYIDNITADGATVAMSYTGSIQPMMLQQQPTTSLTLANTNFVKYNVSAGKVAGYDDDVNPNEVTIGGSGTTIFLANTGRIAGNLSATVNITADASNHGLRVAIYAADNTASASVAGATYTLVGIWGQVGDYAAYETDHDDPITNGLDIGTSGITAKASAKVYGTDAIMHKSGDDELIGSISAGIASNRLVKVVVWFEGGLVTNAYQGTNATFDIAFDIAEIPAP